MLQVYLEGLASSTQTQVPQATYSALPAADLGCSICSVLKRKTSSKGQEMASTGKVPSPLVHTEATFVGKADNSDTLFDW